MSELFISKDSVEYAKNIIVQYLRDAGYEGSMEDGTGIHDIVIKPSSILFAMLQQQIDKAEAYLSLSKADELRGSISTAEYDAAIDSIMSNWFVTRTEGTSAYGTIRLYFSQLPEYIKFSANKAFATYNTVNFATESDLAFSSDDFISVLNTTSNITEFYIDVPVKAQTKEEIEIPDGTLFTVLISDIYFLRGEAVNDFVEGTDAESSDHFVSRSKECINTRELITYRAIKTVLTNNFGRLLRLYIAGAGESEMIRDIVQFQSVNVHVGNMADIWISADLYEGTQIVKVNPKGYAYTSIDNDEYKLELDNLPLFIDYIKLDTDDKLDSSQFELKVTETKWLESTAQPTSLFIPSLVREVPSSSPAPSSSETAEEIIERTDVSEEAMTERIAKLTEYLESLSALEDPTVTVHYYQCILTPVIHNFVYNDYSRVASYDPQVKMMTPVLLKIELDVLSSDSSDEVAEDIQEATVDYVNGLSSTGNLWVESDMIKHIHNKVSSVVSIQIPTNCMYTLFDMKNNKYVTGSTSNKFSLPTNISKQITNNTIQFHTELSLITVNFM